MNMKYRLLGCSFCISTVLFLLLVLDRGTSFSIPKTTTSRRGRRKVLGHELTRTTTCSLCLSNKNQRNKPTNNNINKTTSVEEYRNAATKILSNFLSKDTSASTATTTEGSKSTNDNHQNDDDFIWNNIDWNAPKVPIFDLSVLAQALDAELYNTEWFVTGKVNPIYFADEFRFQDPDVKLSGIRPYAEGVRKLFDQEVSRAEIIETKVTSEDTITCTWRLSGKVNVGPGLTIKPYIVYTDFTVREGLIIFQEDRFDIPQWDILFSAFFPFLIGKLTSPPAPVPPPRDPPPTMPKLWSRTKTPSFSSPFDSVLQLFTKK